MFTNETESRSEQPSKKPDTNFVAYVGPMGNLRQVSLEPGTYSVQKILDTAGMVIKPGYEARVDGETVSPSTIVETGATVYLLKSVAGN
ncbi:MAG TPA: hypothetical protein V6C81_13015 [Planktothrix sp.]|jgi:hypothetical protein